MADAISIQELIDARTDAKTLEEAVNGDAVTTVLSRLGETYPTLSNALNQIDSKLDSADTQIKQGITNLFESGGLPATPFATKALMTASALVDGDFAMVTDDTVNNGLYVKTAGAWVKSEYDPLAQAKADATNKANAAESAANLYTKSIASHSNDQDILEVHVDALGNPYKIIYADGSEFLSGVDESIQDKLSIASRNTSESLVEFRGVNGELGGVILKDGVIAVNDVLTKDGLLSNQVSDAKSSATNSAYSAAYKINENIDGMRAYQIEPQNISQVLVDANEYSAKSVFGAALARTGKNSWFLSYDVRSTGGDYDPIYLVGRTVTVDPTTGIFSVGASIELADSGVAPSGLNYSHLNPTVSYIEFGVNAGRILVHFNYMEIDPDDIYNSTYRPAYVYSDDGGATFSGVTYMDTMFPMADWGDLLNFGPGHGVQIQSGEYKGRLILSAYHRHPVSVGTTDRRNWASRVIYSDDGGDTYQIGAVLDNPQRFNEWQAVETFDGGLVGLLRIGSGNSQTYIAHSYDGGATFTEPKITDGVAGAGAKAGFTQISNSFDYSTPKLVASRPRDATADPNNRVDPHLWVSYDDGETFPHMVKVATGICQYSDTSSINPDSVLLIYCGGTHDRGNQIIAHTINLNALLES